MKHPELHKEHVLAGQGAILLCAVLWSTSGLFIKLVDWHPVIIAGCRSMIAAIFLFIVRLVSMRKTPRAKNKPRYVIAGGLAYAATMTSFVIANKLTASANVILLQYTAPVWSALLGWLLIREKNHWEQWGALVMVMAGLVIFFREGLSGGGFWGNCLALLSGLFFGANSVAMRMQKEANPADSMLLAHILSAAVSIPFFFLYPPHISAQNLGAIFFLGIFQIGIASLLFSYGIKRVSAIQAMLTAVVEPVLNPVWVFIATGEKPSSPAVLGGGVIVAAVVISSVIGNRREHKAYRISMASP
jgi:drug/metabolite transporter (DMT)-like permease